MYFPWPNIQILKWHNIGIQREPEVQVLEWLMKFVANNVCMMWSCAMADVV